MPSGIYGVGGALNTTLNDTTTKGAYMPDGSLRVTDVVGAGLFDSSGALRIASTAGNGVYATNRDAVRYSDALLDGHVGVYAPDGSMRMLLFGVSAQAQQFFNRLATQPTPTRKITYERIIDFYVLTGVWAKGDILTVAGADAATTQTNLIQGSFGDSVIGTGLTFAADLGYTGSGSASDYLNSSFNPTVGTPNYTQNGASLFAWKGTAPVGDHGLLIGDSGENSYVEVFRPADELAWAINAGGNAIVGGGIGAQIGLFGATRTASNAQKGYYNGIPTVGASAVSSMPSATYRSVGDGISTTTSLVRGKFIGGALTQSDIRNLTVGMTNYLNELDGVVLVVKYGYSSDVVNDGANNFAPGIGRLLDGRLISVYAVGGGIGGVDGKLAYKTSSDAGNKGIAWSTAADAIAQQTGRILDYTRVTVFNGSILVVYADRANDGTDNKTKIIKGTVATNLTISWSAPINVTSSIIVGPNPASHIVPRSNGNLLLALTALNDTITIIKSTDNASTWGDEHIVTSGSGNLYGYMDFVEKSDLTLFGVLRADSATAGNKGYWTTTSVDVATWTPPVQIFNNTVSAQPNEVTLVLTPAGNMLLFGRFNATASNNQGGYTYSTNGGTIWASPTIFYSFDSYSYGQVVEAQGFYDTVTGSVLLAVGQGNFTVGEIIFQQFYVL